MSQTPRADLLLDLCGGEQDRAALEVALEDGLRHSQARWPEVSLSQREFIVYLAERVSTPVNLGALELSDLYLAAACTRQDPRALEYLRPLLPKAAGVATRGADAPFAGDIELLLWERLFVGEEGGAPKMGDYLGTGPLLGWLCAIAVRLVQSQQRAGWREIPADRAGEPLWKISAADPELEVIRGQFRAEFREAFRTSLHALEPRSRVALRLHFVEGLNIERIGHIYRVHRATVARWLASSREQLLEGVRRQLKARLKLESAALSSLARVVDSQFDLIIHQELDQA